VWTGVLPALDGVRFDREERYCLLTQGGFRGQRRGHGKRTKSQDIQYCRTSILRACSRAFEADPTRVESQRREPVSRNLLYRIARCRLRFDARAEVKMRGTTALRP